MKNRWLAVACTMLGAMSSNALAGRRPPPPPPCAAETDAGVAERYALVQREMLERLRRPAVAAQPPQPIVQTTVVVGRPEPVDVVYGRRGGYAGAYPPVVCVAAPHPPPRVVYVAPPVCAPAVPVVCPPPAPVVCAPAVPVVCPPRYDYFGREHRSYGGISYYESGRRSGFSVSVGFSSGYGYDCRPKFTHRRCR